ncbi:hypothetical protein HMPREF1020_00405 [Clostridium sp. 7_3_54FAA]|nr:hypothetical protein HMPREF1020_00405 [Clostridium sp. 7_3_54FAA]DAE70518.1 MAG TPA: STRUCTURAL MAINTENANCE OF CHROMOSOMES PROTEIN [Caudoviricetes sp.]
MLQFTSLTVENFGPFKGCQTIDFTNEDGVTIIWGNNGRGKTTLLNIFRYALFGRFQNRRGANVDLTAMSNIEGRAEGHYDFKVILKMQNDGKRYELTRQFVVRSGIKKPLKNEDYEQKVFLKEDGSILPSEARDHVLNLIMPQEVSRFFLFDGELLQEYEELLLEDTDVGETIKSSIEKILGVPLLTNGALDTFSALEEYKKEKGRIAQSNANTQKIAAKMAVLEAEKKEHNMELERLTDELSAALDERGKLEDEAQQNEHIQSLLKSIEILENSIKDKTDRRDDILNQICLATKDAWKGLISSRVEIIIKDIESILKKLEEKESSQKIAMYFLEDMQKAVSNEHCHLCDQDIEHSHILKLKDKIDKTEYGELTTDEKQQIQLLRMRKITLESMKSASKKEIIEMLESQLDSLNVELDDANRQYRTAREDLEKYGDIEDLTKDFRTNAKALAQCLKKIDNYKEGCQEEKEKIKEIDNALNTLEEKLKRASTDSDMMEAMRKVELCEQINNIFETGIASYRDKLKLDVERDATNLFLQISNDPDYVSLRINENYGLQMLHVTGEMVPLRSAGFEHVVALSLIGALHKNAPLRGPIIMDSPFGRLDPIHKNNITNALPNMSDQIILLAYTHEIDEQQARETLGSALKKEYRLTRYSSFHTEIEPQMN